MTIHMGQAIVFLAIGIVEGVLLTDWYREKKAKKK
jgi:hypothetical protein